MSVLLLLRHGQASLGAANYDELSELGSRQAQLAGLRLARSHLGVERIVCGALERQRDTASAVMVAIGKPPSALHVDDRLDEFDHTGVLAAHTSAVSFETATPDSSRDVQSALDEALMKWAAADTGYSETHAGFVHRVGDVVDELTAQPGCTVAVTSGGVIAVACARLLGVPVDRWPSLARGMVNASISKIITGRSGKTLLTFNDHAHLESDRSLITYR